GGIVRLQQFPVGLLDVALRGLSILAVNVTFDVCWLAFHSLSAPGLVAMCIYDLFLGGWLRIPVPGKEPTYGALEHYIPEVGQPDSFRIAGRRHKGWCGATDDTRLGGRRR